MPALTVIAKAALPVLMLAGGGVAWASSGGASEPTGAAQAWVDSPMDGERLEPGTVRVRAHASAPGGVTRIELAVDGRLNEAFARRGRALADVVRTRVEKRGPGLWRLAGDAGVA